MFRDASSFDQSLGSWNLESLIGAVGCIIRTAMSCENYSYTLHGWANNPNTHPDVVFGAYDVSYSPDVVSARNYLMDALNWNFQSADVIGTCNVALGVHFMKFTVLQEQGRAVLSWITASESNNSGFEIQRSADGRQWKTIGFIPSQVPEGNSDQPQDYHFYDTDPLSGSNYYRLKQVDFDGAFAYSAVRKLFFAKQKASLHLYPNPAGEKVTVSGLIPDQTIQLVNLNGKVLVLPSIPVQSDKVEIDLSNVAPGIYYLTVTSPTGQVTSRTLLRR